jgi:hypothetical protein
MGSDRKKVTVTSDLWRLGLEFPFSHPGAGGILSTRLLERHTMDNKEVLNRIDEQITICQNKIKNNSATDADAVNIYNLISQYIAGNDLERRIKKNRLAELEVLKATIRKPNSSRQRQRNIFYGKVEMIDLAECDRWIRHNKKDWQSQIDSISKFVSKFPFENNSIIMSDIYDYVIGTGKGSFCLDVESNTPGNMGQKSSLAYYLYWSFEDNSFAIRDGVNKKVVPLVEAEAIYADLKNNLDKILVLADTKRVHLIEEWRSNRQLPISNVLQKILSLYFPDKFIGYYSKRYIYKISAMLGINNASDVFQANNAVADRVINGINNSELSQKDKTVGFTIYLWRKWDEYLKKAVEGDA